jgi:hypothetical protein
MLTLSRLVIQRPPTQPDPSPHLVLSSNMTSSVFSAEDPEDFLHHDDPGDDEAGIFVLPHWTAKRHLTGGNPKVLRPLEDGDEEERDESEAGGAQAGMSLPGVRISDGCRDGRRRRRAKEGGATHASATARGMTTDRGGLGGGLGERSRPIRARTTALALRERSSVLVRVHSELTNGGPESLSVVGERGEGGWGRLPSFASRRSSLARDEAMVSRSSSSLVLVELAFVADVGQPVVLTNCPGSSLADSIVLSSSSPSPPHRPEARLATKVASQDARSSARYLSQHRRRPARCRQA